MAQRPAAPDSAKPQPKRLRRRRVRRRILIGVGVLVLLLVVAVALVPLLAGRMLPGRLESALNKSIQGKAQVAGASFSWTSGQKIGPITVQTPDGEQVANLTLDVDRGLLSLARAGLGLGALDLGRARLTGSITIVRDEAGNLNIKDLAAPTSTPSGPGPTTQQSVRIPDGLTGAFVIESLDVRFIDAGKMREKAPAAVVLMPDLSGQVAISDASSATVSLASTLQYAAGRDEKPLPGGSFSLVGTVAQLTDSSGFVRPEQMNLEARLQGQEIAMAIADTFAGMESDLVSAVGERLKADIRAKGSLENATASIEIGSRSINAAAAVDIRDRVVTTARPAQISAEGPALLALAPGVARQIQQRQEVTFESLPDVQLSLSDLRVRIPKPGQPFNLRNAAFNAQLKTSAISGRLTAGEVEGQPAPARQFTVAPIDATIATTDMSESVSLRAQTSTTIEGQPAGQISIDLVAREPLNDAGMPSAETLARLEGSAEIDQFSTAIAEPFVAGLGLDLTRDVGPTLDVSLRASPRAAGAGGATEAISTDLALDVQSENIRAQAQVLYEDGSIASRGEGVKLQLQRPAPLLSELLAESGAIIDTAGPISLTATDLNIDLDQLRGEEGTDLRAVRGRVIVQAAASRGQLTLAGREPQPWELAPVSASIDARNIAERVQVRASTSATIGGEPAGALNVDMAASNLLDSTGSLASAPAINGRATLQNIATRIAAPWAEDLGIDLPAGIGPQLTLSLNASSAEQGQGDAGRITQLDLAVRSPGLTGDALMTLAEGEIRSRGNGARFVLRDVGQAVRPAAERSGLAVAPGGSLRIDAPSFALPLGAENMLAQASGSVQLTIGGLSVQPVPAPAEQGQPQGQPQGQNQPQSPPAAPITVQQIVATATLEPQRPMRLQLRGSGSHENAPFAMQGDFQIPGIAGEGPVRPLGSIEIRNLPTTLAALIPGLSAEGDGLNPVQLTREVAGRSLSLNFSSTRPQGAPESARAVALTIDSAGLKGSAGMQVTDAEFAMRELDIRARLPESLVAQALDSVSTGLASRPHLQGPGTVHISATPFTIPLGDGARPDLQQAGNAEFRLELEGTTVINNIQLAQEEGPPRDVGPMALQDLAIVAQVPISALVVGGERGQAQARLSGAVLNEPEKAFIELGGSAAVPLSAARPVGLLRGEVELSILDTRVIDRLLNQQGLMADGVGETARIAVGADVRFEEAAPAAGGQSAAFPAVAQTVVTASVESPHLRTREPLRLVQRPESFTIERPAEVIWSVQPAFANWYLLKAGDVEAQEQELVRFISPTEVTLTISKLALGSGPGMGPLAPGVFELDARLNAEATSLSIQQERAQFSGLQAQIGRGREQGTIEFGLQIRDAGGGPGPENTPAVQLTGAVYSVADEQGNLTTDRALLSAKGQATNFPTALLDAMAKQNGMLVETLGPRTSATLDARSLSAAGGNFTADLRSDRATAQLSGTVHEGALIMRQEARAELHEITPSLGSRLSRIVPLLGQFEKGEGQQPAVVTATNMTIPLDGDLSKLNGDISFDPGEATFTTSNVFATLLRAAGQRSAGIIGQRLDPFRATIRNGTITYERFTLPLGEFRLQTEGTVNLVSGRLDVVTYVPFGALSDEAAGSLNTGLGKLLGGALPTIERATMVPIRTSGSLADPQTRPDLQLFARQAGKTLLRPDKLIGGSVKDLFENLDKRLNR